MRLLIVEDDPDLAAALAAAFARRDIAVDHAASVGDAELLLNAVRYAAIILDLGLPDEDGLAALKRLRRNDDPIPVLVLTARSSVEDRIRGLNAGADDYLVKPVDFDELQARLDAVLRRQGGYLNRKLMVGNVGFDTGTREVFVDDEPIILTVRETDLLELLLRRIGRVVPKRMAEDQLFGASESLGSNAIEVYAHRLRKRLEATGAAVRIDTVRGVGYMLRPVE
ncbi:two component transcriptional regulator, winged helix family [Sphingomonas sp. YR710]|jgi:DNA-binding response OmpR family regulator|uniref:response regulator n=1 Tax=Sphingomonas sp. YR710 TaxID=1882773 RepID=UPI000885992B|nr:response regulator [Sphingomonas sp. YR710]SDD38276.1 two component transcriptional regulator, winged helix family [Sphingomonas sp. YR710]